MLRAVYTESWGSRVGCDKSFVPQARLRFRLLEARSDLRIWSDDPCGISNRC